MTRSKSTSSFERSVVYCQYWLLTCTYSQRLAPLGYILPNGCKVKTDFCIENNVQMRPSIVFKLYNNATHITSSFFFKMYTKPCPTTMLCYYWKMSLRVRTHLFLSQISCLSYSFLEKSRVARASPNYLQLLHGAFAYYNHGVLHLKTSE